jgi:uncharacterized protein (DUF362 family)
MTEVAIVYTKDREEGTYQALDLLGINPVKGKKVVLKPNFNTSDPAPASSSEIVLKALIKRLKEMGAKSITLAERSGPEDSHDCMVKKGIFELAEELDFDVVNLANLPLAEFTKVIPEDSHWKDGFLFPNIYLNAESIVETCCLKTHQFGGHFTLSLKNATGLVPKVNLDGNAYMRELHSSPNMRRMIAEINTAFKPDLIVLDGVTAFVDGGPARGTLKEANVILASEDRVAIDAVGVALLRILGTTPDVSEGNIFEQEQIARAVELNLGVKSPTEIELITNSEETEKISEEIYKKLL